MRGIQLVIAFSNVLLRAGICGITKCDEAAGVICRWKLFDDVQGYGVESGWIDLVVHESLRYRKSDWPSVVACR